MAFHDQLPVGTVVPYAGPMPLKANVDTDPVCTALARMGWLYCDGASLPSADFGELFSVIGTAYGGDGQGNFNLPDLRGRFIRGVDGQSGNDPDAGKRTAVAGKGNTGDAVGSLQADAFQGHEHDYVNMIEGSPVPSAEGAPMYIPNPQPVPTTSMETESGDGTPRVSTETRPVNLYLNYIIRFRSAHRHEHSGLWD